MIFFRTAAPAFLAITLALGFLGCGTPEKTVDAKEHPKVSNAAQLVKYNSAGGRSLPMTIYSPTGAENLHRAVIVIHGGGWVGGDRSQVADIATTLAAHGFTAANIDYTLAGEAHWPAQLEDCQAAVRYIRSRAKDLDIDPEWMAATGVSAGGHLSSFLGSVDAPVAGVSSRVQAVGSISGIHDLNKPLTPRGDAFQIVEQLLDEQGAPDRELRKKASPAEFYSKTSAPTVFIQGKNDPLVPQAQSDLAAAKLTKLGVEAKVVVVEGMAHGLNQSREPERKALEDFIAWLKPHLGLSKS